MSNLTLTIHGNSLPNELQKMVLSHLNKSQQIAVSRVNPLWQFLINCNIANSFGTEISDLEEKNKFVFENKTSHKITIEIGSPALKKSMEDVMNVMLKLIKSISGLSKQSIDEAYSVAKAQLLSNPDYKDPTKVVTILPGNSYSEKLSKNEIVNFTLLTNIKIHMENDHITQLTGIKEQDLSGKKFTFSEK